MSKLLIIFAENGRLLTSYPHFIKDTDIFILEKPRIWFLNGKKVASPVKNNLHEVSEPGVLLVYDAHNNPGSYSEKETVNIIRELSVKYKELYVCYHDLTHRKWSKALDSLKLSHTRNPLTRKHTDEPYKSLHAFHMGDKTIDEMTFHWHIAAVAPAKRDCAKLLAMLDDAFLKHDLAALAEKRALSIIESCQLNEVEVRAFEDLVAFAGTNPTVDEWTVRLQEFLKLLLNKFNI